MPIESFEYRHDSREVLENALKKELKLKCERSSEHSTMLSCAVERGEEEDTKRHEEINGINYVS